MTKQQTTPRFKIGEKVVVPNGEIGVVVAISPMGD
jgi:hypothetical protein